MSAGTTIWQMRPPRRHSSVLQKGRGASVSACGLQVTGHAQAHNHPHPTLQTNRSQQQGHKEKGSRWLRMSQATSGSGGRINTQSASWAPRILGTRIQATGAWASVVRGVQAANPFAPKGNAGACADHAQIPRLSEPMAQVAVSESGGRRLGQRSSP